MTHLRLAAAAFAVLGLCVCVPSAEAAKRKPTCKRSGSKTVRQNDLVRVYRVGSGEKTLLVGCRRSTGRRVTLDEAFDDGYVSSQEISSVRLNGWHVAWISTATDISCKAACPPGYDATTSSIGVGNVRTRRSSHALGEPLGGALVVSRTGGVAWAASAASSGVEIRASDRAGVRVLDSGSIDPRSLAIESTIVSWSRDGSERFARLR